MKKTPKKEAALSGPLLEISAACAVVNDRRSELQTVLAKVRAEQTAVARKYENELRGNVATLAFARGVVLGLVRQARALFLKPKSRVFAGVAVGFEKERDNVVQPETKQLIKNIRALLPELAGALIHQPEEEVRAQALKDLTPAQKQMIGVRVISGADSPFVRLEKSAEEQEAAALLAAFETSEVGK